MPSGLRDRQRRERQAAALEAAGAEGHALPVQEDPLRELREGEGGEREIEPAEPKRRQRHGRADRRGEQRRRREGEPERPAEMHLQQAGAIGADAEHRRVGEGELSGIADQEVQPDRQDDVDQRQVGDEKV